MNDYYVVPLAVLAFSCVALLVLIGYISVNITGELQARNKKLNINKKYLLALVFIGVSLIFYLVIFILPPYIFDIIF